MKPQNYYQINEQFQPFLSISFDLFCWYQADGYLYPLNQAWSDILGWSMAELTASPWQEFLHPDDIMISLETVQAGNKSTVIEFEQRFRHQDGSYRWLAWRIYNTQENGAYAAVAKDITQQQLTETLKIKESQPAKLVGQQQTERERLMAGVCDRIRQSLDLDTILHTTVAEVREFLHADRVLIYRFQPDWSAVVTVESVDQQWKPLLGTVWEIADFVENCIPYYKRGHIYAIDDINTSDLSTYYLNLLNDIQVTGLMIVPILQEHNLWGLLVAHHCASAGKWQALEIDLLAYLASHLAIAIHQAELYQKLAIANKNLHHLATSDSLTQLANRRYFDEYLQQEWERSTKEKKPLSLLLCDVDFFKAYNDTYGHQAGDECLQQVAVAISQTLPRLIDLVARYGGEEFAVILPDTDLATAKIMAENICESVKSLMIAHAGSTINDYVTISIGIASMIPTPEQDVAIAIQTADQALYRAKAEGRNRFVF